MSRLHLQRICEVCGLLYSSTSTLNDHMRTHSGEKPFQCHLCAKSFSKKCNLTTHIRIHTGERKYKCNLCDRTFTDAANKNVHMKKHAKRGEFEPSLPPMDFELPIQTSNIEITYDNTFNINNNSHPEIVTDPNFVLSSGATVEVIVEETVETSDKITYITLENPCIEQKVEQIVEKSPSPCPESDFPGEISFQDDHVDSDSSDEKPLRALVKVETKIEALDDEEEKKSPHKGALDLTTVKEEGIEDDVLQTKFEVIQEDAECIDDEDRDYEDGDEEYKSSDSRDSSPNSKRATRARKKPTAKFKHFKCKSCHRTYKLKETRDDHEADCKGSSKTVQRHSCDQCEERFTNKRLLQKHISLVHKKKKTNSRYSNGSKIQVIECKHCKEVMPRRNFYSHLRYIHDQPMTCSECGEQFCNAIELEKHSEIHVPKSDYEYKCKHCPETFFKYVYLLKHVKSEHSHDQYICDECGKGYLFEAQLKDHKLIHTKEKLHKCTLCEKSFKIKASLTIHMRNHTGERPYKCLYCPKSFIQGQSLIIHHRKHTGEKPFPCNKCDRKFTTCQSLVWHLGGVHKVIVKMRDVKHILAQKAAGECEPPPPDNEPRELFRHEKEKPFKCDVCDKNYATKWSLIIHQRTHTGIKPYKCNYCDKSFNDNTSRSYHENMHTGRKTVHCELCDKTYSTVMGLRMHLMSAHKCLSAK